jgi:hypothetical protein
MAVASIHFDTHSQYFHRLSMSSNRFFVAQRINAVEVDHVVVISFNATTGHVIASLACCPTKRRCVYC